jgi:hypothetical protein
MNILCLYNSHEPDHIAPLKRAAGELCMLGIGIEFIECPSPARACHHLSAKVDAILIHQVLLCDEIFACGPPVIILERIDGAQLAGSRAWIRQAAGLIKGYTFRKRVLNNAIRGRWFPHVLAANGMDVVENTRALTGQPDILLPDSDLAKIHLGYGFPAYDAMESLVKTDVDLDAEREFDLHCVCWTDYKGTEIELHRKKAIEVANAWPGPTKVAEGRPFDNPRYERQLLRSKCVLSPWGWGEPCYRDVEAMLAGCVLIKPDTGYVEASPDIYDGKALYLPCKPDFSDVHDIVNEVSIDWPHHWKRRRNAMVICQSAWQPANVAATMAAAIWGILKC